VRAFLAFEVSQQVIESLVRAQDELRETRADVGIVSPENLHFTVKFLGDVPDDVVRVIGERIAGLNLTSFETTLAGVGVFPDLSRPRIVWAGVDSADEPAISERAEAVIEALDGVGKPEERDFVAHVTIGRVKSSRNVEALVAFARRNDSRVFGRTNISSLKLKSSLLTPKGAIYTDVREYALK
jgi:RNA 2',3'-cyclic 3'-phosphodiesterase